MLTLQQIKEHLAHMCPAADIMEASRIDPNWVGISVHMGPIVLVLHPVNMDHRYPNDTTWDLDTYAQAGLSHIDNLTVGTPEQLVGIVITKYLTLLPTL